MEQNKTLGKLNQPPRGPSPSRAFSDLYQVVLAANKKFYKGRIPPEVIPLIQTYAETKYGMMYGGSVFMDQNNMVLQAGDDPVQKAQGIVPNGPTGQQPPEPKR